MGDNTGEIRQRRHYSPSSSITINGGAVAIIALILAALAVGLQIRAEATIGARIAASKAEARAEFADQIAKAQAEMHMASTNALLAKDRTDKVAAELEARHLIKLENH